MTAQAGGVAIGIQSAMGTPAASFTSYSMLNHGIDIATNAQALPGEIGGTALPRGAYKLGYAVAGQVRLIARLDDIGPLLYAAMGADSVTADTPEIGVTQHDITMAADEFSLPWLTIRRDVNGDADVDEYTDCRVASLMLRMPAVGLVEATMVFIGREAKELSATSVPVPAGSAFAVGCKGAVSLTPAGGGAVTTRFHEASITIANMLTSPQETQSIGSYVQDDIIVKARQAQVRLVHRWADRALYNEICGIGATTAAWDSEVTLATLQITMESNTLVGATATPYTLTFATDTNNTALSLEPIQAEGQNLVYLGVSGSILDSGNPMTLTLLNDTAAAYT